MRSKKVVAVGALLVGAILVSAIPAIGQDRPASDKAKAIGKVKSAATNTFTIETPRRGEVNVTYNAETEWSRGSQSDLVAGVLVAVAGMGTDPINATKIAFPKEGMRRHHRPRLIRGEITEVGDGQFKLETRRGVLTVKWNDDTRFVNGTADDLEQGAGVGVAGRPERPEGSEVREEAGAQGRRARIALQIENGTLIINAKLIAFPRESAENTAA